MIEMIVVGKLSNVYYKQAFDYYEKQLKNLKVIEIKESNRIEESKTMAKYLKKDAFKIVLAIEGLMLSSEDFSKHIEKAIDTGKHVQVMIGGSEGIDTHIKSDAQLMVSMSKMTFPHQLARVMVVEQIYRAIKIIEKHPYHK